MQKQRRDDATSPAQLTRRQFAATSVAAGVFVGLATRVAESGEPLNRSATGDTKTAVERIERIRRGEPVRLKPVSRSFSSVIVLAMATDPSGELLAVAGDDHAIRIINTGNMDVVKTLEGHTDLIQSLAFNHKGNLLASAGNDGNVILWNRRRDFKPFQTLPINSALASVRFSPDDNEIGAVGFESEVHLFGKDHGQGRPKLECACTDLRALSFRSDGKMLAVAGRNGYLTLFDRTSDKLLGEHDLGSGRIHELEFLESTPVVISAGENGTVVLFDTDSQKSVARIAVSGSKLFSICVINQQYVAVAGSDNVIRIIDVPLGKTVEEITDHRGSVAALASSESVLFSGSYDATLRRFDLTGMLGGRERIAERDNPIDR